MRITMFQSLITARYPRRYLGRHRARLAFRRRANGVPQRRG
jgi:hypothetical protein